MRKLIFFCYFLLSTNLLFAQNEVGPEGHKLLWVFLLVFALAAYFVFTAKSVKKKGSKGKITFFRRSRLRVELTKDALYYPDTLTLNVTNISSDDVDIDKPLLVFDNFWLKRKFKLKGTGNYSFYPLFLEKGKSHTLRIDLNRFYGHDKGLKKFPKASIYLFDVKGKKLSKKAVFLRKTLFRY